MKRLATDRIIIISGPYGAGKTNISVNLAEQLAKDGKKVCVVDLDIVNPYFRSADNIKELNALGIRTSVSEFANTNVEIPSVPKDYSSIFATDEVCVVDVGGDADGAVILAVDSDRYAESGYSMYFVYNRCRPVTAAPEDAFAMLRHIENRSGLKFTGIINNTNLGSETTAEIVAASLPYARALAELSGLPLCATTAFAENAFLGADIITNKTKQLF